MDRAALVSDSLKRQRLLAVQALRKASDISPQTGRQLQDQRTPKTSSASASLYVPYVSTNESPQQRSLNITELEEEKTIHMATTPRKFSFEPKEMTARSTMNQQPLQQSTSKTNPSKFLSAGIEEILASSFADNIRCMGRSLRETAASVHGDFDGDQLAELSLPRTADMSKLSYDSLSSIQSGLRPTHRTEPVNDKNEQMGSADPWDVLQPAFENSWMRDKINELSQMEEASFRAGDRMESRLLEDEMVWEQENADIPEMNAKRGRVSLVKGMVKPQLKDHVDLSCFSGYLAQADEDIPLANGENNCSVGHYFNKMSDNLKDMIDDRSPPQRTPLPLIDVTNDIDSTRTPASLRRNVFDKENKENSMSVSYIAKAITTMDLEDSPHNFIQKLHNVKRTKSEQIIHSDGVQMKLPGLPITNSDLAAGQPWQESKKHELSLYSVARKMPQEQVNNYQLSDSISFSESIFNASAVPILPNSKTSSPKGLECSANQLGLSLPNATTPVAGALKKPLVDTFRVSTATKLSEEYMDLPPIPRLQETSKCQKNIFSDRRIAKPNRKRRCSSTTRQESGVAKRSELAVPSAARHSRSKSPSNRDELKAVAASYKNRSPYFSKPTAIPNLSYQVTPKISHPRRNGRTEGTLELWANTQKPHLSPEPRTANRSPYTSPKVTAGRATVSTEHQYDAVAEKFNLRNPVAPSRSASQCSGSTEWTHKGDGTLPLKATHSELSWGSTRLRKSEKRTMQIKNTSNRKLLIKTVIVGPGFQLCGTEQSGLLTLQSQECRTISIDFCPTIIGPAIGAVSFHPPNDIYVQRVVNLYGYGGEASIKIEGIQKGPSGPFLELGSARNLGHPLEKSFSLYNKGNLPAFARIGIDKKGLDQALLASAVYVQPQRAIIPPNSYVHIKVIFKPRRQEITKILQKQVDVLSITNLHILWGDEPTRHRIRRNITLAKENDLVDPKMGALESICHRFSDEQELDGLEMFCEYMFDTIHELFLTFREYELVLTVDRALDETMLDLSITDDNGTLFKTMYASSEGSSPCMPDDMISPANVGNPSQQHYHGAGPPMSAAVAGMLRRDSGESWSVRPTMLEFRPSNERTKQFVIKSNFYTAQYFELNSNYRQLFRLSPTEGHIRPGQEVVINVSLQHLQPIAGVGGGNQRSPICVVVYIENEKISIPVQINYEK